MSQWINNEVTLFLTDKGKEVLSDIFGESHMVQVFVSATDELGLWMLVDNTEESRHVLRLIRWGHFESAQLEVAVEKQPTVASNVIGFRR